MCESAVSLAGGLGLRARSDADFSSDEIAQDLLGPDVKAWLVFSIRSFT